MHITHDFPRPLGVPGDVPRFPEAPTVPSIAPRDLSFESTPASEDLRNLLTIIAPLSDSLIREAVERLAKSALAKIEASTEVAA